MINTHAVANKIHALFRRIADCAVVTDSPVSVIVLKITSHMMTEKDNQRVVPCGFFTLAHSFFVICRRIPSEPCLDRHGNHVRLA